MTDPGLQTIRTQQPIAGGVTTAITLTANPAGRRAGSRSSLPDRRDRVATFDLSAGSYTITGQFAGMTSNATRAKQPPATVTIGNSQTIRQDITIDVPQL